MHNATDFCAFVPNGCQLCCNAQINTSEQEACQSSCSSWDPTHSRMQTFELASICFLEVKLALGLKNKNTGKLRRKARQAKNKFT